MLAGRGVGLRELREAAPHEDQLERLTFAWAESIALRGYNRTTVQHIVELSGLSRSTLYTRFGGKDEAFVRVHAAALDRFAGKIEATAQTEPAWRARIAAGVDAALCLAADNPLETQILLGDLFAAGPRMGYAHEQLVGRFAPALDPGRAVASTPLPASLETYLIGSVVSIVGERVRAGEAEGLSALAASLAEFVLTPYIGADEAKRVARERDATAAGHVEGVGEGDSPEGFSAVVEGAFSRLRDRVEPACAGGGAARWPLRVAAAVRASFAFAAEDPDAARLLTFEALSRGPAGRAHHQRLVDYFVEGLRACRAGGSSRAGSPPAIDSAIVGGLVLLVARRLRAGREADLPDLAEEAIEFVLTPHLGTRRARELASRPSGCR